MWHVWSWPAMPRSSSSTPENTNVQRIPSVDVMMLPPEPTATNRLQNGTHATANSRLSVGVNRGVHVYPSGDVRTRPPAPTAAQSPRGGL